MTASLIHRILGLATVRIGTGTASTDSDERLDLDGLPADRARELRAELLHVSPVAQGDAGPAEGVAAPVDERVVLRFDPRWARYAPLTSSGAVITAGLFGGAAQLLNELGAFSRVDTRDWSLDIPVWVGVVLAAVVLVVGVAMLSVTGYLMTNWNFRLSHAPGSWHLSRGLLTTRETSIDDVRLAGVSIGEPLALRLAGAARLGDRHRARLRIRQLGARTTGTPRRGVGRRRPGAPHRRSGGLRAGRSRARGRPAALQPRRGTGARRARAHRRRRTRRRMVVVAARAPAAIVVAALAIAADRARSLGHALTDGYVVARSGSLDRRREVLEVDHVIGWTFRSSWFQRRTGLTTLVATTAGGRQSVTVLDVPEVRAVELASLALPELTSSFERTH